MTKRLRADLSLALCSLLWGATFVVVKSSLDYSSVFVFLAARFSLAAILMAAFRPGVFRALKRGELLAGAALGFFMFGGYAFQTAGLRFTTPAKSGFVTGSSVVLVPLLLGLFWGRRLTAWVYSGVFAAVFGLYFLTVPAEGVSHLNRGDLLTFVAAGLYATHIILVGDYTRRHSVAALSVLQVAACAALAWLATCLSSTAGWQTARLGWQGKSLLGIAICAVLATAVAFSIQLWAQQYTSSSHAAILFTLEPVFASLTSYLILGERLGGRALLGAVLVLAGILIAELLGPPAAPESPEPTAEPAGT
ncbi:MAG TPA: DMT family transporter [Candidatus Acidoferrum sp.]|nr:DMT family transporter [Candidatus Acidoferrum sp.]